jgi:hypothetical protein
MRGAVGEAFWQLVNQPYCRDCVAKAGGEHWGHYAMFGRNVQLAVVISMWSAFTFTMFLVVLVVAMFVAINVFSCLGSSAVSDVDYLVRSLLGSLDFHSFSRGSSPCLCH